MTDPMPRPVSESIWHSKPWWCQPWSIVLTGIALPLGSWLLLSSVWFTGLLIAGVLAWWWVFLVFVPAAHRQGEPHS